MSLLDPSKIFYVHLPFPPSSPFDGVFIGVVVNNLPPGTPSPSSSAATTRGAPTDTTGVDKRQKVRRRGGGGTGRGTLVDRRIRTGRSRRTGLVRASMTPTLSPRSECRQRKTTKSPIVPPNTSSTVTLKWDPLQRPQGGVPGGRRVGPRLPVSHPPCPSWESTGP